MTVLQSIEGKFYDVPEDQATSFEIPREKVKDMLSKAGKMPAPQSGPEGGPGPQRMGPGTMPGTMPGAGPVVVQIFPNGMPAPVMGQPMPAPAQADGDGEVEPYWWTYWRNYRTPWGGWNNYVVNTW